MTKRVKWAGLILTVAMLSSNGFTQEEKPETSEGGGAVEATKSFLNRFRKKPAPEEETDKPTEEETGGLLGGLGNMLKDERINSLVDEVGGAFEKSKSSLSEFIGSSSEANEKIDELLGYLEKKTLGREDAYTDAEIQAHTQKIIPFIEELNHRKFETPPRVKAVGNLQMIKILAHDLVPQIEKHYPDVSKPLIYMRAYLSAGMLAPSLLGKYGTEDQTVYVLPQNLRAAMEQSELPPELEVEVLQIVIGHELTHGLQDQEINLSEAILDTEDIDATTAFNATIEGHAVYIQNALAQKMGLTEAAAESSKWLVAGDLEEDAWVYERLAHVSAVQTEQIYLGGERFIDHHASESGVEKIWEILAKPPKRSSMITQPETYTPTPPPLPDYESEFKLATGIDGTTNWIQTAQNLGDFDLRSRLASTKTDQREHILRGLNQAAAVMMVDKLDLGKSVEVALFEFQSETEATLMAGAIQQMMNQDLAGLDENSTVRLTEKKEGNYSIGSNFSGQFQKYTTDALLIGKSTSTSVIVRDNNLVVHLVEVESKLTKAAMNALIEKAAAKFRQL